MTDWTTGFGSDEERWAAILEEDLSRAEIHAERTNDTQVYISDRFNLVAEVRDVHRRNNTGREYAEVSIRSLRYDSVPQIDFIQDAVNQNNDYAFRLE